MAPHDREKRLDEEVRFHIDMATEKFIRQGLSPEEARRRAQLEFGAREHWKDEARSEFRPPFWTDLRKDFGHAVRSLRRHKGFAFTVILTLTLGVGASTAIFSVVNAVLLRPLPYADADRLTLIWGDMRPGKSTTSPSPRQTIGTSAPAARRSRTLPRSPRSTPRYKPPARSRTR